MVGKTRIGYEAGGDSSASCTTACYPNGLGPSASTDGQYGPADPVYHYGSYVYHNLSFGYNLEPINTMVQLGVDNLTDKQPPIFYQNNVINANTDTSTYDPIGRFYWAKVTVKF
jgi:outer membrane receptor protein involved in Fe transport